ncbi:MAG: hypothetical protein EOS17_14775 [Mesorhizobium sp.]|nr:MAG: hypothetical protein EOS17_14775 [Mesorhizobium sp.]
MVKGGNPSNNHDGEFIVSGPGTENAERFKQALGVSFAEQTATSMNYFKQSDPNDEGQISALGEAKIDYLKAQSGCYWTEETEKWTRAKLKRFADRNDRKRILGNSFDRSEMVVLPRRKDGAMPMETRQLQGDPYEYFHFWPGTFGNYKYSWFNRTGDGRILRYESYEWDGAPDLGGLVFFENNSAGDRDYLHAMLESGIWFTYTPKKTGRLDLFAEFVSTYDTRYRWMRDEIGYSHTRVLQATDVVFGTFSGDQAVGRDYRSNSTVVDFQRWFEGDVGDFANFGENGFADGTIHNFFGRPGAMVFAGQPVEILVGCRVLMDCYLNDVSIRAWEGARRRLNFLGVRVV